MGARILIAEDDAQIAALLHDYLALSGYEVVVVDDGAKLAAKAPEMLPDLIITDIQMPNSYGSTAFIALRSDERTKKIPVLFVSAHPAGNLMPDDPFVRFLQKPIELKRLAATVAELLLPRGGRP